MKLVKEKTIETAYSSLVLAKKTEIMQVPDSAECTDIRQQPVPRFAILYRSADAGQILHHLRGGDQSRD